MFLGSEIAPRDNRGGGRDWLWEKPFDVHTEACIGCAACAEICPTAAIRIEDRGGRRILHTWNTVVELSACPGCGRFFAPQAMAFLKQMHPEVAELWTLCPECRRVRTGQQWLDARV